MTLDNGFLTFIACISVFLFHNGGFLRLSFVPVPGGLSDSNDARKTTWPADVETPTADRPDSTDSDTQSILSQQARLLSVRMNKY